MKGIKMKVTKFKKLNKWARCLDKKQLQHVIGVSPEGTKKPTLHVARLNANNENCIECQCIGTSLKLAGVI
jgi:hypothetical protein